MWHILGLVLVTVPVWVFLCAATVQMRGDMREERRDRLRRHMQNLEWECGMTKSTPVMDILPPD